MITIIFLYSPDRKSIFENTVECMKDMKHFNESQVIVSVDGNVNFNIDIPHETIKVRRECGLYSFANALNDAVEKCKNDIFLYLDCDRVLPKDYLESIFQYIKPKTVLYSSAIYGPRQAKTLKELKLIRDNPNAFIQQFKLEHRIQYPRGEYGKNPFSGNTCMLKEDYLNAGGFDKRYMGYGFPDTDFYMNCHRKQFQFVKIPNTIEIHQSHKPTAKVATYFKMNIWNGFKFCQKWNVKPMGHLANDLTQFDLKQKFPLYRFFADCPEILENLGLTKKIKFL